MPYDLLNDSHNVVRYVKPSLVGKNQKIDSRAFELRETDDGLSVNWLEYFEGKTKEQQLEEVKAHCELTISKNGKFVELSVGETKQSLAEYEESVCFVRKPTESDPSHCELLFSRHRKMAERLRSRLLLSCIKTIHPVPS